MLCKKPLKFLTQTMAHTYHPDRLISSQNIRRYPKMFRVNIQYIQKKETCLVGVLPRILTAPASFYMFIYLFVIFYVIFVFHHFFFRLFPSFGKVQLPDSCSRDRTQATHGALHHVSTKDVSTKKVPKSPKSGNFMHFIT